jgi:hypothetical protein
VTPLDLLNGDIHYECPRVDPHNGGDANLFLGFVTIILGYYVAAALPLVLLVPTVFE